MRILSYTQDSITGDQTFNTNSSPSEGSTMGTRASQSTQSASDFVGLQDAQISPEQESTTPKPSLMDRAPLTPICNVARVCAAPQPDQLGPPTDTESTLEEDWSRIVNTPTVFPKEPKAPQEAASTYAAFVDSIVPATEGKHTLSGQGIAVVKAEKNMQDKHPATVCSSS